MKHTQEALSRHGGPGGLIVLLLVFWMLLGAWQSGNDNYEADRVEQTR